MAEWTRDRRRLVQLAGLALGIGALAGLVLAPRPGPPGLAPAVAHWSLPSAQRPLGYRESDFLALLRAPQWGVGAPGSVGGVAGAPGAAAAATWQLVGVVAGPRPLALLQQAGNPSTLRLAAGGRMSDGTRVETVTVVPAQVTLQRGGCRIELRLYAQVHLNEALTACAPATGLSIERER